MNKGLKIGQMVRHKTVSQTMVVVDYPTDEEDGYICRYYNKITGSFVTELFIKEELDIC